MEGPRMDDHLEQVGRTPARLFTGITPLPADSGLTTK
jgi:hypothetical protein